MIDEYRNLDLRLFGCEKQPEGLRFCVQVDDCPVGQQELPDRVSLSPALSGRLVELEKRSFDADDGWLRAVGAEIGALLFPDTARAFLLNSLSKLEASQGLRIRIRCDDIELDRIPWEFACVDRGLNGPGNSDGRRAFLVLEPRISLVRNEVFGEILTPVQRSGPKKRLLAVLCEPGGLQKQNEALKLDVELANLAKALEGVEHIGVDACTPATKRRLQELLLTGADVFHFAGHGVLQIDGASGGFRAALVLQRDDGGADRWAVDEIAMMLASKGIQLAVLGACHSAATDGRNSWAGIAPSLVRCGIPAVIGMQYNIYDGSAVEFSRMLYLAWSQGVTLDEAMTEARKAILNQPRRTGRDFATPVLYLRQEKFRPVPLGTRAGQGPGPRSVAAVLAVIDELRDYKDAHEALHSARALDFKHMELSKDEFPERSTVDRFVKHAQHLRRLLDDVKRVRKRGRCDDSMLQAIVEEFAGSLDVLNEALDLGARDGLDAAAKQQARDRLEDALAGFDTLLTVHPAKLDACMTLLAKRFDVDKLLGTPNGADAGGAQAAAEMLFLAGKLQSRAAIHHLCQDLDTRLAMIRKTGTSRRFAEIRRHWSPMNASLLKVMVDWEPDARIALQSSSERLGSGVAANDEPVVRQVFESLCDDFDFGFFAVDTDFKALCGEMNARAMLSLGAAG
ncbi:CHAT domain-containing protein [Variovorax sp. JS1663]|uniref:CHAT domain-containing protein n=1 Tax=Variovorax sp. JS1663 TaxID=1851577 RepID=UPI000B343FCF|nr:CHAT domain-containing protein [Variovorax sp. JS1663]OUM01982.1 hypothetical protein A8M77_12765 [Variovorax sp. JS1663]